ncbi:hypothetical protein RCS94_03730 [Orbaceae bacterium ac157xtp]
MFIMTDMPQMMALVLLLVILFIGDFVSTRTKAWVPSVFICAVLFLAGYWTFFPKNIVAIAGIPKVVAVMLMYLLIVNMGTLLSINELKKQWKTILISMSGIVGIIILCAIVGLICFDRNTVVVAIPPLVGGIVSSIIMSDGAKSAGLDVLAVFAIVIYVMQGFAGYPLTSIMLKREGRRVLKKYRAGEWHEKPQELDNSHTLSESSSECPMPKLFKKIPNSYNTPYFIFFRISCVGFLAYLTSDLLSPIIQINALVLCLFFGVVAKSIGFLETHPLKRANGFGFAVMGLMLFVFDSLNHATPQMLLGLVVPLIVLIGSAVVGMFIFAVIMGKVLKVSLEMSFSIALTALYGFPADYIITNEVINNLTKDETERQVLNNHMLAPMLIGGFISVTIVSVILAGVMVGMITPIGIAS